MNVLLGCFTISLIVIYKSLICKLSNVQAWPLLTHLAVVEIFDQRGLLCFLRKTFSYIWSTVHIL